MLMVYQENEGITELLEVTCGLFGKKVFIKFRQNDLHTQGNHYNPFILSHQKSLWWEMWKQHSKSSTFGKWRQKLSTIWYTTTEWIKKRLTWNKGWNQYTNIWIWNSILHTIPQYTNSKWKNTVTKETNVNQKRSEDEEDEQNEPLDLSLQSSSIPNITQTSSQHIKSQDNYSPISYMMDYVCDDRDESCQHNKNNQWNDNRKSKNQVPISVEGSLFQHGCSEKTRQSLLTNCQMIIDGQGLYKVWTTHTTWWRQTSDMRYFLMQTSSWSNYSGIRGGGVCQGSWICPNIICPLKQTSFKNQPNCINFWSVRGNRSVKMCQICNTIGICEGCGTWKLLEYSKSDNITTVYHIGKHVCWVKPENKGLRRKKKIYLKIMIVHKIWWQEMRCASIKLLIMWVKEW